MVDLRRCRQDQALQSAARVPTLVLDDGEVLIESHVILDYLDGLVPARPRMFPAREPARHRALKIAALATGLGDKAVSLFYEKRLHKEVSEVWVKRCRTQIAGVLAVLEAERAGRAGDYWFGERIGHADIAVAAALRFIGEAHPGLVRRWRASRRSTPCRRLRSPAGVSENLQPFIAPA